MLASVRHLILKDVSEVPQYGWFSVLQDPTGAVFALWKPAKKK